MLVLRLNRLVFLLFKLAFEDDKVFDELSLQHMLWPSAAWVALLYYVSVNKIINKIKWC